MCLGVPMRVLEVDGMSARCEPLDGDVGGGCRRVGLALLGIDGLGPGSLLLVHLDTAIRVLAEDEARLVADALRGLAAANEGLPIDGYFADLVGREPELPPHLRDAPAPRRSTR